MTLLGVLSGLHLGDQQVTWKKLVDFHSHKDSQINLFCSSISESIISLLEPLSIQKRETLLKFEVQQENTWKTQIILQTMDQKMFNNINITSTPENYMSH